MEKLYIIDTNGCWVWRGGKFITGYGCYKRTFAHRVFFELANGRKIKPNNHIHHTCHNKLCVNAEHLKEVNRYEHNKLHHQTERKTCKHGHVMDKTNTHVTKAGHWQCRTCNNARQKRYNYLKVTLPKQTLKKNVRKTYQRGLHTKEQIARMYGISIRTVYRYI